MSTEKMWRMQIVPFISLLFSVPNLNGHFYILDCHRKKYDTYGLGQVSQIISLLLWQRVWPYNSMTRKQILVFGFTRISGIRPSDTIYKKAHHDPWLSNWNDLSESDTFLNDRSQGPSLPLSLWTPNLHYLCILLVSRDKLCPFFQSFTWALEPTFPSVSSFQACLLPHLSPLLLSVGLSPSVFPTTPFWLQAHYDPSYALLTLTSYSLLLPTTLRLGDY